MFQGCQILGREPTEEVLTLKNATPPHPPPTYFEFFRVDPAPPKYLLGDPTASGTGAWSCLPCIGSGTAQRWAHLRAADCCQLNSSLSSLTCKIHCQSKSISSHPGNVHLQGELLDCNARSRPKTHQRPRERRKWPPFLSFLLMLPLAASQRSPLLISTPTSTPSHQFFFT